MAYLTGLGGDKTLWTRPHQAGRRLRGLTRAVVRRRAVGGAIRLLAVDDRRRDRRSDRRREDRHAPARYRRCPALPGGRRSLPAQRQGRGRSRRPARTAPHRTSSGSPRTATRTRRSRTTSATAYSRQHRPARDRGRRIPGPRPPRRATRDRSRLPELADRARPAHLRRHAAGTGYYRYGTSAQDGSADGYGDCYQPSQSTCTTVRAAVADHEHRDRSSLAGAVRRAGRVGRCRPATRPRPRAELSFMVKSASGEGLVPEQAWEDPDLPPAPYGSDPTTASIGFVNGQPAGSASPLTWAQAQELRLITDLGSNTITDRPAVVADRYVQTLRTRHAHRHTDRADIGQHCVGHIDDRDRHDDAEGIVDDLLDRHRHGRRRSTVTTTADATGGFTATVPVGFGTNVISAAATKALGRPDWLRSTWSGISSAARPSWTRPIRPTMTTARARTRTPRPRRSRRVRSTSPGFQVLTKDNMVYLRTTLRNLAPTFGNTIGAQLLDVYVHTGGSAPTSTAAAFPSRNYSIAPQDAWSQRLEVQGFASPVWQDANGDARGPSTPWWPRRSPRRSRSRCRRASSGHPPPAGPSRSC